MKMIIIALIIIIALTYVATGRYEVMVKNVQRDGAGALFEEPVWLVKFTGEKIGGVKKKIQDFIDQKSKS